MDGVKEFKREARYAVFKFSKLDSSQSKILQDAMCRLPRVAECVVIESDWPEYNFVWLMLEHRMGGYPVPDFNAVKCAADVQVALAREAALKYKAELYDEVWQKATDMGFMNVTMALEQVAALREELASVTADRDQLKGIASAYIASDGAKDLRIAAAEQRNAFLEAQVAAKDVGIDFRDAMINSVRMSSKELLMAWVPHDWEAKRRTLLSNAKPTEPVGWKVWGGDRCDHCCNGDRCEEPDHLERSKCPYCKGTGNAIWLAKPTELGATGAERKEDDEALQRRHDQERQEYFNDEQ